MILRDWIRLARPSGWAQSKLPFIVGAGLMSMPARTSAWLGIGVGSTVICWAAFGYGLNEIADRATDLRAGKVNWAAGLTLASRTAFLILTAGTAVGTSFAWGADASAPVLVGAGLVLAAAYSVPPIRLKERGRLGILAAAAAQWMVPILAASAAKPEGWSEPGSWALALLGLAIGTRWILVHQLEDTDSDRQAGVRTYVAARDDVERVLNVVFAAEVVLLASAIALTWPRSSDAVAALAVWVFTVPLITSRASWNVRLRSYRGAPLSGYYFVLMPVAMAVTLRPASAASLGLAALLFALGGLPYARRAMERFRATAPLMRRRLHHFDRG